MPEWVFDFESIFYVTVHLPLAIIKCLPLPFPPPTETSAKVRPVHPEKAKRSLEDYYHRLELHSEQRVRGHRKKKRAVSFNHADLQRNKRQLSPHTDVHSEDGAFQGCHSWRMGVDVGLFPKIQAPHNYLLLGGGRAAHVRKQ